MATRVEQKAAARERREAAERAAQEQAARKRRLTILGSVLAVAIVAIVAAVLISTSGGKSGGPKAAKGDNGVPGAQTINARFAGIPQQGANIGRPDAPVTLVYYGDLKCPICKTFSANALPELVERYVKAGKLRIEARLQTFVGAGAPEDTGRAARFALAAGQQGKLWQFADLFYVNQKDESEVYVTDAFLKKIGGGVQGLDVNKAMAQLDQPELVTALDKYSKDFTNNGFNGTPSFQLGRTGGTLSKLNISSASFDPAEFTRPIDQLLTSR